MNSNLRKCLHYTNYEILIEAQKIDLKFKKKENSFSFLIPYTYQKLISTV